MLRNRSNLLSGMKVCFEKQKNVFVQEKNVPLTGQMHKKSLENASNEN